MLTISKPRPEPLPIRSRSLETLPGEKTLDDELAAERVRLCVQLTEQERPTRGSAATGGAGGAADRRGLAGPVCIVASVHALMQPVPTREAIAARSLTVAAGQNLPPETLGGVG